MLKFLKIRYLSCRSRSKSKVKIKIITRFILYKSFTLHLFIERHSGREFRHSITHLSVIFDSQLSLLSVILHHSLKEECLTVPWYRICMKFPTILHDFELRDKVLSVFIALNISMVKTKRLLIRSRHSLRLSDNFISSSFICFHNLLESGFHC